MEHDLIRLVGITGTGYHGVFEHERRNGQPFTVDLVLHVDAREAAAADRLDLTVDYGALAEQVLQVIAGPPVNLLETLAERIATLVLGLDGVQAVDVVVHKPQAPVPVPVGDIAVEIHRQRSGRRARASGAEPAAERAAPPDTPALGPLPPPPAAGSPPSPLQQVASSLPAPTDFPPEPAAVPPVPASPPVAAPVAAPVPSDLGPEPARGFPPVTAAGPAAAPEIGSGPVPLWAPVSGPPSAGGAGEPGGGSEAAMAAEGTAPLSTPVPDGFGPAPVPDGFGPAPVPDGFPAPPQPASDRLDAAPSDPVTVVLALGANVGNSEETLRSAIRSLQGVPGLSIRAVGPLARTAPVGGPEQDDFLNTVVVGETTLSPRTLLRECQAIEVAHGRQAGERWGPRVLDIDLVVHGSTVAAADDLEIPHPRAHERAFVLEPWAHVDPDAVLPGLGGGPVGALAETAPDRSGIRWVATDWWS